MLRILVMGLILSLAAVSAWASVESPKVENFRLLDHHGDSIELYRQGDAQAIVLISYGIGCPIIEKSLPTIKNLAKKYASRGVRFFLIDANRADDRTSVIREAEEFKIDLPILLDPSQVVASSLGLSRTGEVLVIQPDAWKTVYRGAIDDRLGYGFEKSKASKTFLADALDSLLQGRDIQVPQTEAKGCAISYRQPFSFSYSRDIAPIMRKKCLICHGDPPGIKPTQMTSYEGARSWSSMIRETIFTGRMPPFEADTYYGRLHRDFSLTPEESWTLVRWVESGAPEGKKAPEKGPEKQAALPPFNPNRVFQTPEIRIPENAEKNWIYTTLQSNVPEDFWISASRFESNKTGLIQHVALLVTSVPINKQSAYDLAAEMAKEKILITRIGWAPQDIRPMGYPRGTAIRIPKGSHLILEQHFYPSGKNESISGKVLMQDFPGRDPKPVRYETLYSEAISIPPGKRDYEIHESRRVNEDSMIFQLAPHMHWRGQSMRLIGHFPNGSERVLFSVPNYFFKNRRGYAPEEPVFVPKGTRLELRARYDNSKFNPVNPDPTATVGFGGSAERDEMCVLHYWTFPPRKEDKLR